VLANAHATHDGPGVALWAGHVGPVAAAITPSAELPDLAGAFEPSAVLVLATAPPAAGPVGAVLIGGVTGGGRVFLDGTVLGTGTVGIALGPTMAVEAVVAQGCRPIGRPFTVTAVEGMLVRELGGKRAAVRVRELLTDELTEDETALLRQGGLHVGRAIDEREVDPGSGAFLVRKVVGFSEADGWVAVGEPVAVGETLQFHLRDPEAADDELRARLTRSRPAESALVFSGTGTAEHDAEVLDDYRGPLPVAGITSAGELGAVAGRSVLHGSATAIALLRSAGSVGP
jgi:small ligand-binding sensory domain FIST